MPLPGRYFVEDIEAITVEQGLVLDKELGLEKIIVEGDSLLTIQAVETMDVRGVVGHIIKGIGQLPKVDLEVVAEVLEVEVAVFSHRHNPSPTTPTSPTFPFLGGVVQTLPITKAMDLPWVHGALQQ
nr:hypothetical protein CFP56_37937 [Quercus suber]